MHLDCDEKHRHFGATLFKPKPIQETQIETVLFFTTASPVGLILSSKLFHWPISHTYSKLVSNVACIIGPGCLSVAVYSMPRTILYLLQLIVHILLLLFIAGFLIQRNFVNRFIHCKKEPDNRTDVFNNITFCFSAPVTRGLVSTAKTAQKDNFLLQR